MSSKRVIVICSSGSFYEHANQVAEQLEARGYTAVVPATARQMKTAGDYDIAKIKTWYKNPKDRHIKHEKMRDHFEEVAKADAVLLINDDKPNQPSYIGPNGFMEWGLASHLRKLVYILNAVPKSANYWEEALTAIILNGNLDKIKL